MIASKKDIATALKDLLSDHFGENLVSVVLFGSVARGEDRENSDIDLLVVLKNLPQGRLARLSTIDFLWEKFSSEVAIHPILKTQEEARKRVPLYLDMVDEGILLFDRDRFFSRILEDLKKTLVRNGAVRKTIGKVRYWDLRPDSHMGEVVDVL